MAFDSSIISRIRSPRIEAADPMEAAARAMQMRAQMGQADLQGLQADAARQASADELATRSAVAEGGDQAAIVRRLMGAGQYKAAQALEKAGLETEAKRATIGKDNAAAAKSEFETKMHGLERGASLWSRAKDQQSYDAVLRIGVSSGIFDPKLIEKLPKEFDPRTAEAMRLGGITEAQRLDAEHKASTLAETTTHNRTTEGLTRTQQIEAAKHNRATEGAAYGNLGVARERLALERNAPKGIVQQTNDGTVLIDPRDATARPVIGADGKPLAGKPLKDIPTSVLTGMMENNRSVNKVNQAIAAVSGNQAGLPEGVTADKNATGWKGYLPNAALSRMDPKGVDARALIADIGSLKIHDRSGAAVTAAETPRLMPFIPLATDTPDTIKKKLGNFKREYELMQQETGDYYSADNGFKPYKPAGAPAAATPTVQTATNPKTGEKLQLVNGQWQPVR